MYAILWTIFFVAAAMFSVFALLNARKDLSLLEKHNRDHRALRTIALGDMREELVRVTVYFAFSIMGVFSLLPAFEAGSPLSATIPTVLTIGGFGMFVNSVMAHMKRKKAISERP